MKLHRFQNISETVTKTLFRESTEAKGMAILILLYGLQC